MMKFRWRQLLPAAALILSGTAAEAKVELAPVFSDNAVLQRDMEVPVWGWADPGESVTVKFADQTQTTTAGTDGKWMVKLSPLSASKENRTLEASGPTNTVSAKNVLVGEVWIASGQSNMEMPLWGGGANFRHRNANGTGKEVADKTNIPTFRFTRMPRQWSREAMENEPVKWNLAGPGKELEAASATAFFFARELAKELDVPVGIIGAYWGGTRIEPWTPPEGFNSVPELANIARTVNAKLPGTSDYKAVSDKVMAAYTAWMEKQGHTFFYLTDEERAPFLAPLGGFVEDWKASCKGAKPEVIEAVYKYAQERAKFYTEEMRAGKYGDYKM